METEEIQIPIFVYGTLRPGAIGHRLIRDAIAVNGIRPATLQGFRMYNFRDFPGILPSTPDTPPIIGELFTLKPEHYISGIQFLDRYLGGGLLMFRVDSIYVDVWKPDENFMSWQDRNKYLVRAWVYIVNEQAIDVDLNRSIKSNDWMNRD